MIACKEECTGALVDVLEASGFRRISPQTLVRAANCDVEHFVSLQGTLCGACSVRIGLRHPDLDAATWATLGRLLPLHYGVVTEHLADYCVLSCDLSSLGGVCLTQSNQEEVASQVLTALDRFPSIPAVSAIVSLIETGATPFTFDRINAAAACVLYVLACKQGGVAGGALPNGLSQRVLAQTGGKMDSRMLTAGVMELS
jgi:hypothetical protein